MVASETLRYNRITCDSTGESHLNQVEVEQSMTQAAPPAPPFLVSAFNSANAYGFFSAPAGWFGDWHPVPTRQFMVLLSGKMELETSDDCKLIMVPGDVVLFEDTRGKGHRSRNISADISHYFVTRLPTK